MPIDKFDIIIFIICIILTIIAILFINRDKINCNICKEELQNNSLEDNIKLIKTINDTNKN